MSLPEFQYAVVSDAGMRGFEDLDEAILAAQYISVLEKKECKFYKLETYMTLVPVRGVISVKDESEKHYYLRMKPGEPATLWQMKR